MEYLEDDFILEQINIENCLSDSYVRKLIVNVSEADAKNLREREREKILAIASESIFCMLLSIRTREEEKNELEWLINQLIGKWIWKITETPYSLTRTKYKRQKNWSNKALIRYVQNEGKTNGLIHEHVLEKKDIIDNILALKNLNKETIKHELQKAECCIDTKCEHGKLNKVKNAKHWKRYRKCGIEVYTIEKDKLNRKNI